MAYQSLSQWVYPMGGYTRLRTQIRSTASCPRRVRFRLAGLHWAVWLFLRPALSRSLRRHFAPPQARVLWLTEAPLSPRSQADGQVSAGAYKAAEAVKSVTRCLRARMRGARTSKEEG